MKSRIHESMNNRAIFISNSVNLYSDSVKYLRNPNWTETAPLRLRRSGLELRGVDGEVVRENGGEELGERGGDRQLFDLEREVEDRVEAYSGAEDVGSGEIGVREMEEG